MTNQFAPIYNQLFCCSCPGGLADGSRCENRTGDVLVSLPGEGEAWWLVGLGLLALLLMIMGTGMVAYFCCHRNRSGFGKATINMSRLRSPFPHQQSPSRHANAFVNPTYNHGARVTSQGARLAPIDSIVEMDASGSDDSLDDVITTCPPEDAQYFHEDPDCPDTRPMITDSGGDSS